MLTREPRRAGVLGSPISHSLSPVLHHAAYGALALGDWSYEAYDVQESALRGFVAGLGSHWAGLSLTMPLKEAAFGVADEVSDLAREVGAINTLVRRPDGGWRGHNTDVYGVSQALREAGCAHVASSLVLGSGATARSVVAALAVLGCAKVTFAVRSQVRQETLDQARRAGLEVAVVQFGQMADLLGEAPVVVSTLPAGALPTGALPAGALPTGELTTDALPAGELTTGELTRGLPQESRPASQLFLDVVYAGWPTPLARGFEERGAVVLSGLELLVHQAAEQVHLMTGLRPPVEQMRAAGLAAMAAR